MYSSIFFVIQDYCLLDAIIGFAEKVFPGGRVWGVEFYPFSGGQLPKIQEKSP
jgi:hypothetical protein